MIRLDLSGRRLPVHHLLDASQEKRGGRPESSVRAGDLQRTGLRTMTILLSGRLQVTRSEPSETVKRTRRMSLVSTTLVPSIPRDWPTSRIRRRQSSKGRSLPSLAPPARGGVGPIDRKGNTAAATAQRIARTIGLAERSTG